MSDAELAVMVVLFSVAGWVLVVVAALQSLRNRRRRRR